MESHISQQFLMNLRLEFESIQSASMNREVFPDLDTSVQEILIEEVPLHSQHTINDGPKDFATASSENAVFLTARGLKTQCYESKGYGRVACNCKKNNFCS